MKNLLGLLLMLAVGVASAADTKLTWHGHATFSVVTPSGNVLVMDPWLKGNPKNPNGNSDNPYQGLERVDFILLTHAHPDHVADVTPLGKKTGASLVTNYDLGNQMVKLMGYPKEKASIMTLMNIGGQIAIADGEVTVAMTEAKHSSGLTNPFAGDSEGAPATVYAGNPAGFVLSIKGGPTIYHTGDTSYFSDMKLIGEMYQPDIALLSVGDKFTMGMTDGAMAAQVIGAKVSVPQHWGTFPVLAQDPGPFVAALDNAGMEAYVMEPGETLTFSGSGLKK
jgi:L-ascorbate metabolism protein UlaG (beta-lactamase superfamily)